MYDLNGFPIFIYCILHVICGGKLLWLQEFAENFHAYGYIIHTSPVPYMHDSTLVIVCCQAAAAIKEL